MRNPLRFVITATGVLLLFLAAAPRGASPRYSAWSEPVWLGSTINSSGNDLGAALSKDGLTLYFTSTRPGGFGAEDIWVSYRSSVESGWGAPINLGAAINSAGFDRVPALSRDGHWLFYARGGPGFESFDIWGSYRQHTHEDFGPFGWQEPIEMGALNTPFAELAPAFFQDEDTETAYLFFTSNRPEGAGDFDLYVSERQTDGSFGAGSNVIGLNSPSNDGRPTISHDGLEIIFHSNRAGSVGMDLWSATRESLSADWSSPVNLTTVNSEYDDTQPFLSADGLTLYFASTRPGGLGGIDLWMATRTRQSGRP